MQVIEENSRVLEQETVKQSLCELRKNKKNRITSINAHRVFTKKLNVQTLAEFLNPNLESAATRWSHL